MSFNTNEAARRGIAAAERLRAEIGLQGPVTMKAAAPLLLEHYGDRVKVIESPKLTISYIARAMDGRAILTLSPERNAERRAGTIVALLSTLETGLWLEIAGDSTAETVEADIAMNNAGTHGFVGTFLSGLTEKGGA